MHQLCTKLTAPKLEQSLHEQAGMEKLKKLEQKWHKIGAELEHGNNWSTVGTFSIGTNSVQTFEVQ